MVPWLSLGELDTSVRCQDHRLRPRNNRIFRNNRFPKWGAPRAHLAHRHYIWWIMECHEEYLENNSQFRIINYRKYLILLLLHSLPTQLEVNESAGLKTFIYKLNLFYYHRYHSSFLILQLTTIILTMWRNVWFEVWSGIECLFLCNFCLFIFSLPAIRSDEAPEWLVPRPGTWILSQLEIATGQTLSTLITAILRHGTLISWYIWHGTYSGVSYQASLGPGQEVWE